MNLCCTMLSNKGSQICKLYNHMSFFCYQKLEFLICTLSVLSMHVGFYHCILFHEKDKRYFSCSIFLFSQLEGTDISYTLLFSPRSWRFQVIFMYNNIAFHLILMMLPYFFTFWCINITHQPPKKNPVLSTNENNRSSVTLRFSWNSSTGSPLLQLAKIFKLFM